MTTIRKGYLRSKKFLHSAVKKSQRKQKGARR